MNYEQFDSKQNSNCSCAGIVTVSWISAIVKLVIILAEIGIYCILFKITTNYTLILLYALIIDCVAVFIFVEGYIRTKIVYLSWYYIVSYLLVIMKLAILSVFIYASLYVMVSPYSPLILMDIFLLIAMRCEIQEHKKKHSHSGFTNKLANCNNMFNITIPSNFENVEIHGVKNANGINQEKNDLSEYGEAGIIATDTFLYM